MIDERCKAYLKEEEHRLLFGKDWKEIMQQALDPATGKDLTECLPVAKCKKCNQWTGRSDEGRYFCARCDVFFTPEPMGIF